MRFRVFTLGLLALAAPAPAQDRFRLADPQALSARGNGWSVEPRLGALSLTLPVAAVPGEIPVPVSMEFAAQFRSQRTDFWEWIPEIRRWIFDYSEASHRPILATQHFGFIANAGTYNGVSESKTYVLESGAQVRQEDFVTYTSWVASVQPAVSTFALPTSFQMLAKANASVSVTASGDVATYAATPAELGTWQSAVAGLAPAGYTLPSPLAYQVVMDRDRARVLIFLSQFNAWVPLLWVDRYGHSVSFQWTRGTSGLPAGISAIHTVKVLNQRGKGLQLEWAQFSQPFPTTEQDLARTDFIGYPAPSVLVRGLPGWSLLKPVGFTQAAVDVESFITPSIPGPMGRPTRIQTGSGAEVPLPSWQGSAGVAQPSAPPPSALPILTWTFAYDANAAALDSFTEPNGTTTRFSRYESLMVQRASGTNYAVRSTGLFAWSIAETASTDALGNVLRRDWTRSSSGSGEPVVTMREAFGDLGSALRKTELTFAAYGQTPHYGNGALKMVRVLDAAGAEWAKTTFTLATAGLGATYSTASGQVIERNKEPKRTLARVLGTEGLQTTKLTTFVGAANLKVMEEETTFETKKELLDIQRPTQIVTTRFKSDGTVLLPTRTRKVQYDAKGLPTTSYVDGGSAGVIGQVVAYDAEGRLSSEAPGTAFENAPHRKDYTFDAGTGLLTRIRTSYTSEVWGGGDAPPQVITSNLDKAFANFDPMGRPQTLTDERGVSTALNYDLRGRVLTSQRQGEAETRYEYPDELTRTQTRSGQTTTEHRDGFGRLQSVDLPGGRSRSYEYDIHGRTKVVRMMVGTTLESPQSMVYDALDRMTERLNPAGTLEKFTYDVSGNEALITSTLDSSGVNAVSTQHRDAFGQVVRAVSPLNTVTQATYDGLGNPLTVTQTPVSGTPVQTRTFTYDALGRQLSKNEPETGVTTFAGFNALGQPTTLTEDKGASGSNRVSTLSWDNLGRLTKRAAASGEYLSYSYAGVDLVGLETKHADGTIVSQAFEYLGGSGKRLSKETTAAPGWTGGPVQYGYDTTGRMTTLTYPSGRMVIYGVDSLGRINAVTQAGSALITGVTYSEWTNADDWGSMERVDYASGAFDEWTTKKKDSQTKDWVLGFKDSNGALQMATKNHHFNSAGQMTQAGEWSLVHDVENRIIEANSTDLGVSTRHDYDAFNNAVLATSGAGSDAVLPSFSVATMGKNRIPKYLLSGLPTGWDYTDRGEATKVGVLDANGAVLRTLHPTWDGLGRLWKLQENEGGPFVHQVTYAPSGLRIRVVDPRSPGNSRRYAYTASGLLLGEYSDAGAWMRDVVYMGGRAVAEVDAAGVHELHSDHLGTPRVVTKGATAGAQKGQIEGRQAYGPYGERLTGAMVTNGYVPLTGYTGHVQTDPTGLIYMRGRYYSPQWRHFLNSDQGVDPNSMNQMAYVGGSPFSATDPSGMKAQYSCDGQFLVVTEENVSYRLYNPDGSIMTCAQAAMHGYLGGGGGPSGPSGGTGGSTGGGDRGGGGGGGGGNGGPGTPPTPPPCKSTGANFGLTASLSGQAGNGVVGVAGQASVNVGFYGDGLNSPNADTAVTASAGATASFAPWEFVKAMYGGGINGVLGAAAGPSAGVFFGNAATAQQTSGPAQTTNVGVGLINVSYTQSGNIWSTSITFGKPSTPYFSTYTTHTAVIATENNRNCK